MRKIDAGDPNRLTYRDGGGCLALFGLPFLCMGVFTAVMAIGGGMKGGAGQAAGAPVTRKPETLNESLRERAQRTGEEVAITAPPPVLRSKVSAEGNRVVIDIPPAPLSIALLAPLIAIAFIELFVIFMFFVPLLTDTSLPPQMKLILGAFIGVFFIGFPVLGVLAGVLRKTVSRSTIEADPQALRVRRRGLLFGKTEQIPADKLEDLRLDQNKCLAAFSDEKTLRFGEGLPREELDWLRRVILKAVTIEERAGERVDTQ